MIENKLIKSWFFCPGIYIVYKKQAEMTDRISPLVNLYA